MATAVVVALAALFASGSRSGTVSAVIAVLAAGAVYVSRTGAGKHRRRFVFTLGTMLLVSLSWLGADVLMTRVGNTEVADLSRLSYWRSAAEMVRDYPIVGMGGGAWFNAYPHYRDPELRTYSAPRHTHNDYMQMLAEIGIVGFVLFALLIVIALWHLLSALRERNDPFVRAIVFGSLTAMLSLLLHGFTDNNFQVTSTSAYFYVIMALGLATARLPRESSGGRV